MAKLKKQLIAELNKLRVSLLAHKVIMVLLGVGLVIGVAGVALAGAGFSWGNVEKDVAAQLVDAALDDEVDEMVDLGAVSSPFLPGPEFAVGKDLQFSVTADLSDATSTWAFATPFLTVTSSPSDAVVQYDSADRFGWTGATTTVDLVRLNMTSSTATAYQIGCGGGATRFATSSASYAILNSDSVAAKNTGVIENDVATTAGAEIAGGTVRKIHIGPKTPYIVCRVYSAAPSEFNVADGVSPGSIVIRFSKNQ